MKEANIMGDENIPKLKTIIIRINFIILIWREKNQVEKKCLTNLLM